MKHKHRRSSDDVTTAPPQAPGNMVTMYGVALVDGLFVPVKASVRVEDTEPLGAAGTYMEFAYDKAQSELEDESLKRATHRYGVKS